MFAYLSPLPPRWSNLRDTLSRALKNAANIVLDTVKRISRTCRSRFFSERRTTTQRDGLFEHPADISMDIAARPTFCTGLAHNESSATS